MEKFKLGVVGCGGIMAAHVGGMLESCNDVELTAACDIIIERAQAVADKVNPNAFVTTDWKTMADYVDGVLIALPHDLHYECGVFFARNKKHLLMEKPICNTEEECVRLIGICEEEKVVFMCGYPVRFRPGMIELKRMLDSGEYGKPIMMQHWTEQLTMPPEGTWATSARLGGGQLFSHGCHHIDVLMWFLGNPVAGSHFGTRNGTPWMMKEGSSMVTMKFENGCIGYHGATWGARGTKQGYSTQIHCEKAMIEYNHYAGTITVYDGLREHIPGETNVERGTRVVWEGVSGKKNMGNQLQHFIHCVRTGEKPITDARIALQSLRVIWALYDAEERGVVADLRDFKFENAYKW
jgi:predicted dehydrogenase